MGNSERIAFGMIVGLIIVVGTSTALAMSGAVIPNEYRMGVVAYGITVSFIASAVFGRSR